VWDAAIEGAPVFVARRLLRFHRGFVEGVTFSWNECRDHLDAIRLAQPVKKVTLMTMPVLRWKESISSYDRLQALLLEGRSGELVMGYMHGDGDPDALPNSDEYRRRLLAMAWPGIKFTLPLPEAPTLLLVDRIQLHHHSELDRERFGGDVTATMFEPSYLTGLTPLPLPAGVEEGAMVRPAANQDDSMRFVRCIVRSLRRMPGGLMAMVRLDPIPEMVNGQMVIFTRQHSGPGPAPGGIGAPGR
jgi:hypothetical protein